VSRIRPMMMTALMANARSPARGISHGWARDGPAFPWSSSATHRDTLLTIFLVPLLYPYFEEKAAKG